MKVFLCVVLLMKIFTLNLNKEVLLSIQYTNINKQTILDVERTTFESAFGVWRDSMIVVFKTLQEDYDAVVIDRTKFRAALQKHVYVIPINKSLQQEWLLLIEQGEQFTTGKQLFEQLIRNDGACWNLMNNPKNIKKHYNCNRRYYKGLNVKEERLAETLFPQKDLFLDALESSTNPNDPELSVNKLKKAKEDAERAKLYQKNIEQWLKLEQQSLNKLYANTPNVVLKCSCLDVSSSEVSYNQLSEINKTTLLQTIKTNCKENSHVDTIDWPKMQAITREVVQQYKQQMLIQEAWRNYTTKEIDLINFPTNIGRWLVNCAVIPSK